jgi:hypothetical protein
VARGRLGGTFDSTDQKPLWAYGPSNDGTDCIGQARGFSTECWTGCVSCPAEVTAERGSRELTFWTSQLTAALSSAKAPPRGLRLARSGTRPRPTYSAHPRTSTSRRSSPTFARPGHRRSPSRHSEAVTRGCMSPDVSALRSWRVENFHWRYRRRNRPIHAKETSPAKCGNGL